MTDRLTKKLSSQVATHVPEFIRSEYPLFVEFLESYYKFMEQDGKSQEVIQNIKDYGDIDKTVDTLISRFFQQYADGLPQIDELEVDRKLFIKRISDMYASKGTELGYQFLFRVLFNETIDFYYPASEILRASDGKWQTAITVSVYRDGLSDPFDFENTTIIGDRTGATATVNHVMRYYTGEEIEVYELTLDPSTITGNFSSYERIRARKLLRLDGSNRSTANVRKDLAASEVYPHYLARPVEFQAVLFEGGASEEVARRRFANLVDEYGWTEADLIILYNEIFPDRVTIDSWRSINPLVNHPTDLNQYNAYQYYFDNPTVFAQLLQEYNASERTIRERLLTTARQFNWTAEELVLAANKALRRSFIINEWSSLLLSESAVYTEVTGILYPMLAEIDVVKPGLGYLPGDIVEVSEGDGIGALAEVLSVTSTGGIRNVRVLESGVNYNTSTVLTPIKSANNKITARQILRNNIATLTFDRDHGLSVGDQVTITNTNEPEPIGENVQFFSIYAAGQGATIEKHGIFDQTTENPIFIGNGTHTVSIYDTNAEAFSEHVTYDIRSNVSYNVYDESSVVGFSNNLSNWSYTETATFYNLANIFLGPSNVHVVDSSIELDASLPVHSEIRVRATIHMIDNWQNETVQLQLTYDQGEDVPAWTKAAASSPVVTTNPDEGSLVYVGRQNYDKSPFFGSIVMDASKPSDFTTQANAYLIARTEVDGLQQPPTIIQSNIFLFGSNNGDDFNTSSESRIIQRLTKFNLENFDTLYYNINPGLEGTWGEDPDGLDEIRLEYSLDGDNWYAIDTVTPSLVPKGSWSTRIVSIPEEARTAALLRFIQSGVDLGLPGPVDTFALTSVVTDPGAVTVDNGYMIYDSDWLPHTQDNVNFVLSTTLPSGSLVANLYVSNVVIDVKTAQVTLMTNKLNSTTLDDIVIVHTWEDAGVTERLDVNLTEAMLRIGATVNGWQTSLGQQSAYILIGSPDYANIGAYEYWASYSDFSASNYISANIKLDSGNILGPLLTINSIPDDRTIQYRQQAEDSVSNVNVYLESAAILRPNINPVVITDPFWKNNDGKLSENMFVQGRGRYASETDPIYYQQYSYVIRSEHPLNQWRDYAYNTMHPAGFALFSQLKLQTMPENVINVSPVATFPVEIQDFFAITADKAQRTSPTSTDFRTDMTVFPPPTSANYKLFNMKKSHAFSTTLVNSDYVTVQCLFRKMREESPGAEAPLLSKWLSYEINTTKNLVGFRITRQNYSWFPVVTQNFITLEKTYLVTLTYNGVEANLYMNGVLTNTITNAQLSGTLNNDPGIIGNQNRYFMTLNSTGPDPAITNNPAGAEHSFLALDIYDRALTGEEVLQNWNHYKDIYLL